MLQDLINAVSACLSESEVVSQTRKRKEKTRRERNVASWKLEHDALPTPNTCGLWHLLTRVD
ncbi:hypothetical protein E2542_SST28045 [Spatholobus suberectus]|nr:hypothetical protein E2542_SST28045 [Spatholobus suberectus]